MGNRQISGKKILILIICILTFMVFIAFSMQFKSVNGPVGEQQQLEDIMKQEHSDLVDTKMQTRNLQKLCKVWGYVKYTHPVFLLGQKDWDEKLLNLIPIISSANSEEEASGILYDWFIELGEIQYGTLNRVPLWVAAKEEDKHFLADSSWISDESYLGESLSTALSQLQVIPNINRENAPVDFDEQGRSSFTNEKFYANMDYSDIRYRLLGLFRLWNAMEYYFPYLNIIDDDWNELLFEYIPIMLEGKDKQSYDRTLAAISIRSKDAHTMFSDRSFNDSFLYTEFGGYSAPVVLVKAEGQLVIKEISKGYEDECPLMPGDVILKLNGEDIEDVIEDRKQYIVVPNDEKIIGKLSSLLLKSHVDKMEITVLRGNEEMTFLVKGYPESFRTSYLESYELLDNNIGLINPSKIPPDGIDRIMNEFAGTDGLIVDLRQYPSNPGMSFYLSEYIVDKRVSPFIFSLPSKALPGVFLNVKSDYYGRSQYSSVYQYEKKVVLLMNERTMSAAETSIMSLRNGSNVIVMGENSIGGNGDVVFLPLPGGKTLMFSGLGVYTPEGSQTQRIGLSPDIYIEQTIEGIKEGRDEYIEAAVKYILENQ